MAFLFQCWKEQTLNISSEYIQIMSSAHIVSSGSHCVSRFLLMPLKAELIALWVPRSHSRDFCSEESRCEDNRTHLKSLEAYGA